MYDFVPFQVERLKLISENTDDIHQANNLSNLEYVKLLVPEDKEQTPLEPSLPSHILSLHALRALPLLEQCRQLLKDGNKVKTTFLLYIHILFLISSPSNSVSTAPDGSSWW